MSRIRGVMPAASRARLVCVAVASFLAFVLLWVPLAGAADEPAIAGTAFVDANGNGELDAGEVTISGLEVSLEDGSTTVATATTGGTGAYSFTELSSGSYTVVAAIPSGMDATSANPLTVELSAEESVTGKDFGFAEATASVGGTIFDDVDGDGSQDSGEAGKGGVAVTLTKAASTVATTTSDGSGAYSFTDLLPGAYTVSASAPSGWTLSTASPIAATVTMGEALLTVDFGVQEHSASIGDTVFNDANGNGLQDSGELGVPDVTVTLSAGPTTVDTAITDASGAYLFASLAADSYSVALSLPTGYSSTTAGTVPVVLTAGQSALTADFGLMSTAQICPNATIQWTGGAGTDAWSTSGNWQPARVPTTSDYVCVSAGASGTQVSVSTAVTIKGIRAYKPLHLSGGLATTDPTYQSEIGDTTWSSGSVSGSVTVRSGATLVATADGGGRKLFSSASVGSAVLTVAAGATFEVNGYVALECGGGSQLLSLVNQGTIEVGAGATQYSFDPVGQSTCAGRSIVNAAGATIGKTVPGYATTLIRVPVENHGLVVSSTGKLSLRTTPSGVTSDGLFRGVSPGWVAFGSWSSDSASAYTVTLDPGHQLEGDVRLESGVLAGAPYLAAGASLTAQGGKVSGLVTGPGAFTLAGSTLSGNGLKVTEGSSHPDPDDPARSVDTSRVFMSGSLAGSVEVLADATLTMRGAPSMASGSTLLVNGDLVWPGGVRYFVCSTCTLRIAPGGTLELHREAAGVWLQSALVSTGTFENNGLVRFTGQFPGVSLGFSPSANVVSKGMATMEVDIPQWLEELGTSTPANLFASNFSVLSPAVTLFNQLKNLASGLDNMGGGCVSGTVGVTSPSHPNAGVYVTACTVSDAAGDDAVTFTFGGAVGASTTPGWHAQFDAGWLEGYGKDMSRNVSVDDMGGLFFCSSASAAVEIGFTGSHCWGPASGSGATLATPYDLADFRVNAAGVHTLYGGFLLNPTSGASVSSSASYTVVVRCGDWITSFGGSCPQQPKITGISPASGPLAGGNTVTITGSDLGELVRVQFIDVSTGTPVAVNATVVSSNDAEVQVTAPAAPRGVAGNVQIVVTTRYGNTEVRTSPTDRIYQYTSP